jgi:hypothetical protein
MEDPYISSDAAQREISSLRGQLAALHMEKANASATLLTMEFENIRKTRIVRGIARVRYRKRKAFEF